MQIKYKFISAIFAAAVILLPGLQSGFSGNTRESPYRFHELTIYAIPSVSEFDWGSPSSLLKSYIKGHISKPFSSNKYVLGHMFVKLTSPLLYEPLYAGMINSSYKDFRDLAFREKIGLGILGIGVDGEMEDQDDIENKIKSYARKGNIASITYRLNDISFRRIADFLDYYSREGECGHNPSLHYGGAFWPLYEYEGAGCSAFAIAIAELAGIRTEEREEWRVEVNIPMKLIGGELNGGKSVSLADVLKTHKWHDGTGEENIDFIPFWIYDPTLIYKWILSVTESGGASPDNIYTNASCHTMPRLFTSVIHTDAGHGGFLVSGRNDDNIFIQHYLNKNGLSARHSATERDVSASGH